MQQKDLEIFGSTETEHENEEQTETVETPDEELFNIESEDEENREPLSARVDNAKAEVQNAGRGAAHRTFDLIAGVWKVLMASAILVARLPEATVKAGLFAISGVALGYQVVRNTKWFGFGGVVTMLCGGAVVSAVIGLGAWHTVVRMTAASGGYMMWTQALAASLFTLFASALPEQIGD